MKKTDKLFATIQYISLNTAAIQKHTQDWLVLTRLLYTPTYMEINKEDRKRFSLKDIRNLLDSLGRSEDLSIVVGNDQNQSRFHLIEGNLLEKHLLAQETYQNHQGMLLNYIDVQMATKGLFGYLRSYDEFLFNNTESIQQRLTFETVEEIDQLPMMRTKEGEIAVDCNQFAGYDIFYKGFCLTSCWRMYFSSRYRQIIPIPVIEEVQQVEKVEKMSNDVLLVELYRDPFRWDEEINTNYQRLFRDQMGIDQLAWNNGIGILREPFIEYAYTDNMIQTVQYQNERMQPTQKKEATRFVTRTYDLVREQYQEKRVKGVLNARAYFPWVDNQGMKMMNYLVLNPEYSLDDGLAAYEFYIRNYLEIEVDDEKYPEFMVVLNIYIPDEYVRKVPFDTLKQNMRDIKFSRLKKRKQKVFFDLKKGKNHLRVNFVNFSSLEKLQEANEVGG